MLRKAKKNERDGWDASSPDKKKQMDKEKQKNPKKPPEPPKRKEPRKARLISGTTSQTPRPVVKYVPTPKKSEGKPRCDRDQGAEALRERVAMVGAGTFEVGIGLPFAALNLYFVFRDRASPLVLVLLVVALTPILGVVIGVTLIHALDALLTF